MFNNLQNIVITNADEDVWKQIGKVNLNAHNPNHGAPDHLSMVNNLLGDNAKKRPIHGSTNLGNITQAQTTASHLVWLPTICLLLAPSHVDDLGE